MALPDVLRAHTSDERAQRVAAAVRSTRFGPVAWTAETGSTNADLLSAAADGAPDGTVLVADHQTAGRGRRDRTWTTAPGDALLVSILLRPPPDGPAPGTLTAALAVAAAEACSATGHAGVAVKWPNDLVVGRPGHRRKLAGVLAQATSIGRRTDVVVGMGLNLVSTRLGALADQAVALDQLGPGAGAPELLIEVLTRLDRLLTGLDQGEADELWRRYEELSATLGTEVRVGTDDGVVEGRASAITGSGALVVDSADGRVEVVVGDVVSLR